MSSVRDRNESAWLLPDDGTRDQPPAAPGHAPLRRHRRGRPRRRRLRRRRVHHAPAAGPSRLEGRRPRRRPVLGPRRRLGQRRGRLAPPVLDRAAGHLRRTTRCRWARTTPAAASAARWCTTPATRPRFHPSDFRHLHPRRRRRRLADRLRGPASPTTRRSRRSCRSPARSGPGATRTPTRTARTRSAATARSSCAAPTQLGHHGQGRSGGDRQRPVRQPAALHLPRLLPAGLQGQRQGVTADHPHPRRARRTAPRSAPTPWSPGSRSTSAPAAPPGCTTSATASPASSGPAIVAVAGYSIETPRLLLNSASTRFPDGLCNDFDQVGRYLMVQGAPQTAGRFDAEVRMYKAPPPEVSTEAVLRDRPDQALQARLLHPDRLAAADHLGRARRRPGPLGRRRCAST